MKEFMLSSSAMLAGDFVFVSGMAATGQPAPGTVAAETRQILANRGEMLEAAGSSLAKVVKVNVLIYSMLDYDNMNSVYREFFPGRSSRPDVLRREADRRPQGRDRMRRAGLSKG